jgi:putative ABC transport system ATP-binding protein
MTQPIIELRDIRKSYQMGDTVSQVLQGVSLTIYPGEYVCIMGPSGCGKSTLLNVLGCLDQPSSGHYFLGGEDVACLNDDDLSKARCRNLGFIFQSYNLIQQLTVLENIEVPLYYKSVPEQESREIAIRLASQVGLSHRLHHRPTELSGGQQQRVAIARSLANDPLVILADEATGNLDSKSGQEILGIFDDLNKAGKTMVFVTHDERMVGRCTRVIRLKDGEVDRDERGAAADRYTGITGTSVRPHAADSSAPDHTAEGAAAALVHQPVLS